MKPGEKQPELPKGAGEEAIAKYDKYRFSNGEYSTSQIRK
jgi:hypothetical protein